MDYSEIDIEQVKRISEEQIGEGTVNDNPAWVFEEQACADGQTLSEWVDKETIGGSVVDGWIEKWAEEYDKGNYRGA